MCIWGDFINSFRSFRRTWIITMEHLLQNVFGFACHNLAIWRKSICMYIFKLLAHWRFIITTQWQIGRDAICKNCVQITEHGNTGILINHFEPTSISSNDIYIVYLYKLLENLFPTFCFGRYPKLLFCSCIPKSTEQKIPVALLSHSYYQQSKYFLLGYSMAECLSFCSILDIMHGVTYRMKFL